MTALDLGGPNDVRVDGIASLDRPSWILTEQPRTLSQDTLTEIAGEVSFECLTAVRTRLGDCLDL
ncbi:hypothetical protein P0L94_11595 [Microbacter sp. GSS18]|nr:hypothetical protein P0L94_11595 [Microbacter sp. GSS18]